MATMNCQYVKIASPNNHDKMLVNNFTEKIRSIVSACIRNECEQLRKCLERANNEITKLRNEQFELKAFKLQLEENTRECKRLQSNLDICNGNILALNSNLKTARESSSADEVHRDQVVDSVKEITTQASIDHSYINQNSNSSSVVEISDSPQEEEFVAIENIAIEPNYEVIISVPVTHANSRLSVDNVEPNSTLLLSNSTKEPNSKVPNVAKDIVCDNCGEQFTRKSALNEHKRTIHGGEPLQCTHCGEMFQAKRNLSYHIFSKHYTDSQKPYQCPMCPKKFVWKNHMNRHMASHGSRSHKCSQCDKSFILKCILKRHELEHELRKSRPHKCPLCGKSFIRKCHLKQHQVMHGPPSFKCATCGKLFLRKLNLEQHETLHQVERPTPYQCSTCGKAFTFKLNLKRHQLVHVENKPRPYKCSRCDKAFVRKHDWTKHEKNHLLEGTVRPRPFKCPTCDKAFAKKANMRRHQKLHKSDESTSFGYDGLGFDYSPLGVP